MAATGDTYLSFLLHGRHLIDIHNLFLLGLARILPMIAIIPFLGGKILPDPVKIGFGILLVPVFLPYIVVSAAPEPIQNNIILLLLAVKEVMIGFILAFIASVPFYFSQSAGSIIDNQRGAQSLQVTDPSTQVQSSPTGLLYNDLMLVAFFTVGGPLLFFDSVFQSYQLLPADQFLPHSFFSQQTPLFHTLLHLLTTMVRIATQLSAPALITILLSDLFLGIANRMAPQVQVSFLLWSMKAFLGIAALFAAWWLILKQLDVEMLDWLKMLRKLSGNLSN